MGKWKGVSITDGRDIRSKDWVRLHYIYAVVARHYPQRNMTG